jgi:PAS domain S-box-containing protein
MNEQPQSPEIPNNSDDRYRLVFDEAGLGMKWVTPEGRLAEVNRRFCALLGYERDELLGRQYRELTHPDDVQRDELLFARLLGGDFPSYSIDK